ncbi:nitroreductase [Mycolicibacterium parafortuitum]|uniref:Nitroreductase n=1 Tax=Mycolicibacterium parafortuitum TaxID=39692 RepID=A0A375YN31_MYCPF|nr:nitroreductase [Mycolicibacterium parafortuitum]ORB28618.1 nitroreductase [Mycolicibacterium parafortuitum]SRX82493.1 hypothetical protein MPP7335_04253 [Mycolicibacterium parafortuitum]
MLNTTGHTVTDAVRVFNKHVLNPVMLRLAGRRHWYAAVIRHSGRATGRHYSTPVVADRVADGFIIPLPYGQKVDWLRNAQAANAATLVVDGQSFAVSDPRIVSFEAVADQLPARRRRIFQRFGINEFVTFEVSTESGSGPS